MKKLKDTDFLCISSRIHSADKDGVTPEKLLRLAEARDFDEALSLTREMYGVQQDLQGMSSDYGKLLSDELTKAYLFASELIGGMIDVDDKPYGLINPFRFVYDCQNLKMAIKCEALKKSTEGLVSENGSVSKEKLIMAMNTRDFSAYPSNMAAAAPIAIEELARTDDPREVDLILDKAAFCDMAEAAKGYDLDYLKELMKYKADSVNITTAIRCINQGKSRAYLDRLLVPGGVLDRDFFMSNYDETIGKLISALAFTEYSDISKYSDAQSLLSASEAEKLCSMLYIKKAYSAERVPFGAELVIYYIVKKEYEIKNVRIILADKACGMSAEKIRERLMIAV